MNNKKLLVASLLLFAINNNKINANFFEDIGVERAQMVATVAPPKPVQPTKQNIALGESAANAIRVEGNTYINQGASYQEVTSIVDAYHQKIRQAVLNTTKGGSPTAITTLQKQAIDELERLLK